MKKIFIAIIITCILTLFTATKVLADYSVADASGELRGRHTDGADLRLARLRNFLESYNSPLAPYAGSIIESADKFGIDWRLVPAITGVESTFGKHIPYESYNAYGWAGGLYRFSSWEESIETVSKSLKEDYVEKGAASISQIGRRYCPPNPAWAWKVKFFMDKLEPLPLAFTLQS